MSVGRFLQQAAAGNAGEAVYVDDVFSTYLYDGTGSAQTITNGIDLDGEGGMVWFKARSTTYSHHVFDTERGATKRISTDTTSSEATTSTSLTAFNNNGFSLGSFAGVNLSNQDYASWTFRKQPGFFDVVTYTGDGTSNRNISHNLGSVPGCILIKNTSLNAAWVVYHRSLPSATYYLELNSTAAQAFDGDQFSSTAPTDSVFTVGPNSGVNRSGDSFVAYIFAHDAQDFGTNSDESIIKCGTYTGNGSSSGLEVDLGFEPQWLLVKTASGSGSHKNWWLLDNMRGIPSGSNENLLAANLSDAETINADIFDLTGTGVIAKNTAQANQNGMNYIYIAIRRPHKPAEEFAATDLFDPVVGQVSGKPNYSSSTGVVDAMFRFNKNGDVGYQQIHNRLTAPNYLISHSTAAESTTPSPTTKFHFAMNDGWGDNIGGTSSNPVGYMFRRAPGFFDVVAYTGDGTGAKAFNHNLNVAPELIINKVRNSSDHWYVFVEPLGAANRLRLNLSNTSGSSSVWNSTAPTATQFTVGSGLNASSQSYVNYLFATVPGISKVGSYTGTGADLDVNCGFTSGARFVLVKRTDSTGDWYVWDAENGIAAGNDPYMLFNSYAGQVTSTDYIDPLSSGFTITSSAPAALNASGGTYIFLAIA